MRRHVVEGRPEWRFECRRRKGRGCVREILADSLASDEAHVALDVNVRATAPVIVAGVILVVMIEGREAPVIFMTGADRDVMIMIMIVVVMAVVVAMVVIATMREVDAAARHRTGHDLAGDHHEHEGPHPPVGHPFRRASANRTREATQLCRRPCGRDRAAAFSAPLFRRGLTDDADSRRGDAASDYRVGDMLVPD